VLLLGRRCNFDEPHARRVAALALELFDAAQRLGLHAYAAAERELLEYAALLHDIGVFLAFVNHQAHTHYLIRNADLVGFDQTELALIAALARFHRKGRPRATDPELAELDLRARRVVRTLYVFLRLAERLDRSHHGVVQHARLRRASNGAIVLLLQSDGDCALEVLAARKDEKAFARAFGHPLSVRQTTRRGRSRRPGGGSA
jgi:exopolyphosphatase/guanosine-5'-triphosphate,3'-diphosphate pyrophosphatase